MMTVTLKVPELVQQKLAAFERLQTEFEESFRFVQEVQGQKRFSVFPISSTVQYLHALWICECKDRLLSVYRNINRYDWRMCLELLLRWQEQEDTASVVAFLHQKLDTLPFADITRQIHEALGEHKQDGLAQRLIHGRMILLNRSINLMQALDALFSRSEEEVFAQVRQACEQYGHRPDQIGKQLEEFQSPLYAYVPHQALAQRSMTVMNGLGISVLSKPADLPGRRSWRVVVPAEPFRPFAEHVFTAYEPLNSPWHNNILAHRFVDRPERSRKAAE
ncbi:MAG: hypothetical protein IMW89_21190 [Ktedonobacteraceae bacterium]|nr:hypothetical protein [Ktedonobacteraceae bacterium]